MHDAKCSGAVHHGLERALRPEGVDVVDHRCARRDRGPHYRGLDGIDRDRHRPGGKALDERHDAVQLLLLGDRLGAGPRGLATDVQQIGAAGDKLLRMTQGGIEVVAVAIARK